MEIFCPYCKDYTEVISVNGTDVCPVCKNVLRSEYLPKGTIISGFQIEEEIGRGAMGTVYKARQINLNRYVALKILSKELSEDFEFVERFFSEARSVGALSHPNIVQAYDAGATPEGIYYLAMELIEGETLETRIKREGSIEEKLSIDIALKIASALKYAWDVRKICHGDIKPENIILNSSGDVKLADLGLAMSVLEDNTGKELMATPLYAPPEIISGELKKIGDKSDMYSFGATLYHMLAGVPPFPGEDSEEVMKRHLTEEPQSLKKRNKNINSQLSDLVDKLLAKKPNHRPADWKTVIDILKQCRGIGGKKVFHKSVGKSGHIRHDKFSKSSVTKSSKKISSPKSGISFAVLIGIAAVLICAVISIIAIKKGFYSNKKIQRQFEIARQNVELRKAWDNLKIQVKYAESPEKGLEEVKNFMERWGDRTPSEAQTLINKLKHEILNRKREEKQRKIIEKKFDKEVKFLLNSLKKGTPEKLPSVNLIDLTHKMETIFKLYSTYPFLSTRISIDNYRFLTNRYMDISLILSKRREIRRMEQTKKQIKEEEILAKEKEKTEKKAMLRKKRQQMLNDAYDEYYCIIAEFTKLPWKKRTAGVLYKALGKWKGRHEFIPETLTPKLFLQEKYLIKLIPIKNLLVERAKLFLIGETLPARFASSEFKVFSVSKNSIKLFPASKVKIGKVIHWEDLEKNDVYKIIKNKIYSQKVIKKLTNIEQASLLFFLISAKKYKSAEKFLEYCSEISEHEKNIWKSIIYDFRDIKRESTFLIFWKSIKNFPNSTKLSENINSDEKNSFSSGIPDGFFDSAVYMRHKNEIDALLKTKILLSPSEQLKHNVALLKNTLKEKKYISAFHIAITACMRYGQNQNIPLSLRQNIITLKNQTLQLFSKRLDSLGKKVSTDEIIQLETFRQFKFLSDHPRRIFCWGELSPSVSYLMEEFFKKEPVFSDKFLNTALGLYTAINYGEWIKCKDIYQFSRTKIFIKDFASDKVSLYSSKDRNIFADLVYRQIGDSYKPAIVYAYGYLAWKYADKTMIHQAEKILFRLAEGGNKNSINWLFRYLLLIREYASVKKFVDKHPEYIKEKNIYLLYVLSLVQQPFPDTAAFSSAIKRYMEIVNNHEDANVKFFRLAYYLLKRNCFPPSEKLSEALNRINSDSFDPVSIEIFLDALFSSKISLPLPKQYCDYILPAFGKFINHSPLYSGRLWKQLAVLKFTQAGSQTLLMNPLCEILEDMSPAGLPYYPQLIILLTSIVPDRQERLGEFDSSKIKDKDNSKKQLYGYSLATKVYKKFIGDIPVASETEINAFELLDAGDIDVIVQDLFLSGQYENAFSESLIGFSYPVKNKKEIMNLKKCIRINNERLLPCERYLLKYMEANAKEK